jgi:hypothetical protein
VLEREIISYRAAIVDGIRFRAGIARKSDELAFVDRGSHQASNGWPIRLTLRCNRSKQLSRDNGEYCDDECGCASPLRHPNQREAPACLRIIVLFSVFF